MTRTLCPGQDTQFWKPGDIFEVPCPCCGQGVEFFKDDARRRCLACGHVLENPGKSMGCATWCGYADQCLGNVPSQAVSSAGLREGPLVQRLIEAMKKVFGSDQRRITHALRVLDHAEAILAVEGGDPRVVLAAAVLHDIGIHEAEKKYGSPAGRYQEKEGPAIARPIMEELGLDPETVAHVEKIIANHHSARDIDTLEFRILWDADWLVNIPDEFPEHHGEKMENLIAKIFKTKTGGETARRLYL